MIGLEGRMAYGPERPKESSEPNWHKEDERFDEGSVINLLRMSEQQMSELRSRVEANRRTIYIAVHPYYDQNSRQYYQERGNEQQPHGPTPDKLKRNERITGVMHRLLASDPAITPPINIFEEVDYYARTAQEVAKHLASGSHAYLVPTMFAHSVPVFKDEDNIRFSDVPVGDEEEELEFHRRVGEISEANFKRLANIYWAAGVEHIFVGGMNLVINDHNSPKRLITDAGKFSNHYNSMKQLGVEVDPYYRKCVSTVLNGLKDKFDTRLSLFTSPNNRRQMDMLREDLEGFKK